MNDGNDNNKNEKDSKKETANAMQIAEAEKVWKSLQKQIRHFAEKLIRFNSINTMEDYINEAFLGCYDGICGYDSYVAKKKKEHAVNQKAIGWSKEVLCDPDSSSPTPYHITQIENATLMISKTIMKVEVFAFWHVQKRFFVLADMKEVVFNVFTADEKYIETLTNSEYRKKKKDLEARNSIIRPSNIFKSMDNPHSEEDEDYCQEFVDSSFMGFNEEIRTMLQEDFSKLRVRMNI